MKYIIARLCVLLIWGKASPAALGWWSRAMPETLSAGEEALWYLVGIAAWCRVAWLIARIVDPPENLHKPAKATLIVNGASVDIPQ